MKRINFNQDWRFQKAGTSEWQAVSLPHDAMLTEQRSKDCVTGHAGGFFPGGIYVYEKTLDLPEKSQTVLLEFEGIYQRSKVFVNGQEAGGWPYGYSRFLVDPAPFLHPGEPNHIRVVADNSNVPNARWYSGSGIYRTVSLLVGGALHIQPYGVRISTLSVGEPAKIQVETKLSHPDPVCQVQVEILDGETVIVQQSGTSPAVLDIPNAKLWSDVSPHLYSCRVTLRKDGLLLDEADETFGIRSIECRPQTGLRINGKVTKLRGACVHHDNGVLGSATFEAAEERRVRILKEAGFNAIRSSHYPLSVAMLGACDRYGMIVMDELTDMWWLPKNPGDYSLEFMDWWEHDLQSMVEKDFNHPAVILYSMGNEISETALPKGAAFSKTIAAKARELDSTRLVTIGTNLQLNQMNYQGNGRYKERSTIEAEKQAGKKEAQDITTSAHINTLMNVMKSFSWILLTQKSVDLATRDSYQYFDVAGYNYGTARYVFDGKLHPDRVIVGSETYPPDLYENWQLVKKLPYLIGDFQWTGWDYLGEGGIGMWQYGKGKGPLYKAYPCILADTGVIDITGHVTAQAYYNLAVWGVAEKPYIGVRPVQYGGERPSRSVWRGTDAIASWSWMGCEGKPAVIDVFSNADQVELQLNGKTLAKKKVRKMKVQFRTKYTPGRLEAIAYDAQGKETSRKCLISANETTQLTLSLDTTVLKADGQDLAFLSIDLTDNQGNLKVLADRKVTVTVSGAGTLQGFGSARPFTEERFTDSEHTTYYGHALAVIRAGLNAGTVQVHVSAEGCETQVLTIRVEEPAGMSV